MTIRFILSILALLAHGVCPAPSFASPTKSLLPLRTDRPSNRQPAPSNVTYHFDLAPGSPEELSAIVGQNGTSVENKKRIAEAGAIWIYKLVLPPRGRFVLRVALEGEAIVTVAGSDGKPVPTRVERGMDAIAVFASAPASHPVGGTVSFKFKAPTGPATITGVKLDVIVPDSNGNGLPDLAESLMGVPPGQNSSITPKPPMPHTSFQTGQSYSSGIAVTADAALVYSNDEKVIHSWAEHGYAPQTMGGFRDGDEYVKQHPGEVQTDVNGSPITIGKGSYYLVPTANRIEIAKQYYAAALTGGSTAICPEEPEFWARGGYSEAFKQEWLAKYGTPWQAPHSSIDARYKSEQLKSSLETRIIDAILADSQRLKPSATRMVAVHSPVTYYQWGIPVAHNALFSLPALQEIIGQVWTGTARTPARAAGNRAERTFEVGLLEYSSLYHLTRGTGKRLWFLMDPVEDNPDLPLADYRRNYEQTLLAALMFPGVDNYEVMPWPQRIYGKVPAEYATEINTIAGALGDLWRFNNNELDAGTPEIGTFIADSMGWQRENPSPSDYDGFYGLALPLVMHGVPVQVLSLDRAAESGYLDRVKVLFLSYDFLKPASEEINKAIAGWVSRGGALVLFDGNDAYNGVLDSWWRKTGLATPTQDLLQRLSIPIKERTTIANPPDDLSAYKILIAAQSGATGRRLNALDLTPFARENGSVCVRFEDATPGDGFGAFVASAELRIGGRLAASFRAGSEIETRFLVADHGSKYNGDGRFADRDGFWVYRFDHLPPDTPITLTVDMGQGFQVRARPAPAPGALLEAIDKSFGRTLERLRIPPDYPVSLYSFTDSSKIRPLYGLSGQLSPSVWEAVSGRGSVVYAGIAPGYLTVNAQSDRWMRALARFAYQKNNGTYREQAYFRVKRGPYVGIRTLGHEYSADGRYIDLFSPTFQMVEDPVIPPWSTSLYFELGSVKGAPRFLAASGRIRARHEELMTTAFVVQAPSGTNGAARLFAGKHKVQGVKAYTMLGKPLPASVATDGDTLLVRYPNDADGVIVRVGWQ